MSRDWTGVTRRDVLITSVIGGAALLWRPTFGAETPRSVLRFAHLTDMHVKPQGSGAEGYA